MDDVIVQAELTLARKHLPLSGRASSIRFVLPVFTDPRCENAGVPFSFIAGLLGVRHHEKHRRRQATINTLCWRILYHWRHQKDSEGNLPGAEVLWPCCFYSSQKVFNTHKQPISLRGTIKTGEEFFVSRVTSLGHFFFFFELIVLSFLVIKLGQ